MHFLSTQRSSVVPSVDCLPRLPLGTDDLEGRLAIENFVASTTGVAHEMLEASGFCPLIA